MKLPQDGAAKHVASGVTVERSSSSHLRHVARADSTTIAEPKEEAMHKSQNDLPESVRSELVELLNGHLASAVDLMLQAKQAHWNVKGPSFIALHELFDQVHGTASEAVDLIAERAVQLGGVADGSAATVTRRSKLEAYPQTIAAGREHVQALSKALAAFGAGIRKAIDEAARLGDAGTSDLFTEVSRANDKMLWFVEAHLQAQG
jgi:starvation-inducible DNA-binding protein